MLLCCCFLAVPCSYHQVILHNKQTLLPPWALDLWVVSMTS